MTSTFKLTAAEFKKIFKRPSIFIMAIILVATILVSITIFHPANIVDTTIVYDNAETSSAYYDNFYNDININSKKSFDEKFNLTDDIIYYYKALNTNSTLLSTYHSDMVEIIDKMINETNASVRDEHRTVLKKTLENYINAYKSLDALKNYEDIVSTPLTIFEYEQYDDYNYYSRGACADLVAFYGYASNTEKYSSNDVINYYQNNDYQNKISRVLDNGINFITTTITGLAKDFNDFFYEYINKVNSGGGSIESIKSMRANMLQSIKNLDQYLETLTTLDYPTIVISADDYELLNQKIDEAIVILDIKGSTNSSYDTHVSIKSDIQNLGIISTFENLCGISVEKDIQIEQVHLNNTIVAELESIMKNTNENKSTIINNIDSLKDDETITNIQKEVTNYSLLEVSYGSIVKDKIYLSITENKDASDYTNYYGTVFKDFNKYQYKERIALNNYYIQNNTYSNSYMSNFAYSQNSSNTTNVYDFMYFVMELCTIIIIVFAMMLVCNLITGETESGTIKLLLVRPFKRSKIVTAKLLATIFFVLTFMTFSAVITFVGGYFLYGPATMPILAVFNGSSVFTASPFALMLLNLLFLTLDVIFFVLLALMISILCKNYAASISCSLVLLILNYALNILFGGSFWYTLLPGMNLHMFKYFGNAFTSTIAGTNGIAGVIQSLLITGIDTSMTLPYSLFIYGIYSLIFLAVSYAVFQKRDF